MEPGAKVSKRTRSLFLILRKPDYSSSKRSGTSRLSALKASLVMEERSEQQLIFQEDDMVDNIGL